MTSPLPTTPALPPAKRFNPWPASIVAAFVLFISGTIGLIFLAGKDRNDLVARDYYEQEIRYQDRIDQSRRAEPFATEITATYDPALQRLTVSLPRQHTTSGASGELRLYRPDRSDADRTFPIAAGPDGLQYLPVTDLAPGLWKVRIHWKVASEDYFADRQVIITPAPRS